MTHKLKKIMSLTKVNYEILMEDDFLIVVD